MNVIFSIVLIIVGSWVHPTAGILVAFSWMNGFRMAKELAVETDLGYGFTKELSPNQARYETELSLDWVQAIRKITITWYEARRLWDISSDRLPTEEVEEWSIRLN